MRRLYEKEGTQKLFASLLSIVIGLVVGAIVVMIVAAENSCQTFFKARFKKSAVELGATCALILLAVKYLNLACLFIFHITLAFKSKRIFGKRNMEICH